MPWKNFCRHATTFVAAMFFLAVPLTTPNPDIWSTMPVAASSMDSIDDAKNAPQPSDTEGDEPPSSGVGFVEDLLHEHEELRTVGPGPDSHRVVRVIGFALKRPAAVHRPPWA